MIFYVGVILVIVGLGMFFVTFRKSKRPQAVAFINEIVLDYHEKDKNKLKKHPHGIIKYVYQSIEYETQIFLLKRKVEEGDQIVVAFKDKQPDKPIMYAPKNEIIAGFFVLFIGLSLIGLSIFIMDHFELW